MSGDLSVAPSRPASRALRLPAGTYYVPTSTKPNASIANTWTYFSEGVSNYNALQLDLNHRFSNGISVRGVYTWSKTIDDGDSLNATTSGGEPALASNPYDLAADRGLANFDVRNAAVVNATWALPVGHGKRYLGGANGFGNALVSGWTVNSIVTLQGGFPFTPQLSYNPSNNGDTRNPVRPFVNPAFTGPVILGNPNEWFNPAAFLAPAANSGFYGNLGRDTLPGPGLAVWDFSTMKEMAVRDKARVQFRAELFNHPESRQLQYSERGCVYVGNGCLAHGRPDHGQFDNFAANSVVAAPALVVRKGL